MHKRPVLIQNVKAVTPNGVVDTDILMSQGRISRVEKGISADGCDCFDASGLIALPGAIDSHVHFQIPTPDGGFNADDFAAGSAAAVCGGITTYVDFAGPLPDKGWADGVNARKAQADGNTYADYALHMEVTGAFYQDIEKLEDIAAEGIKVLKIYTTYGADKFPREDMERLFANAAKLDLAILAHCEDDDMIARIKEEFVAQGRTGAERHGESRPAKAEAEAVRELIQIAEKTGVELIIAHVSSGEAGDIIADARKRGVRVYAETCPHYLLLTDSCYQGSEPQKYIMTPPLRTQNDCGRLWEHVINGDIGMISTDHCPYTPEQKMKADSCFDVLPGVGGCESMPTLMFSEGYQKGRITLEQLGERISSEAAKIYGLYPRKGAIAVGSDADLLIMDPNASRNITAAEEHSNAGYTIFEGYPVGCTVRRVYLRGELVAENGKLLGSTEGKYLRSAQQN